MGCMNFLKTHSLVLFLTGASLMLAFADHGTFLALQYERTGIGNGELWRLLSGHLLHMGPVHLGMNIAALMIIWIFLHRFLGLFAWWATAAVSSVGISVCLYLFTSSLDWYVGLSGLLHSLITTGSIAALREGKREFSLLLLFIGTKVAWEQYYHPLSEGMLMLEGNIVVDAHLYGLIMGVVCALLLLAAPSRSTGRPAG